VCVRRVLTLIRRQTLLSGQNQRSRPVSVRRQHLFQFLRFKPHQSGRIHTVASTEYGRCPSLCTLSAITALISLGFVRADTTCLSGCSGRGACNTTNGFCVCPTPFFGDSCQFSTFGSLCGAAALPPAAHQSDGLYCMWCGRKLLRAVLQRRVLRHHHRLVRVHSVVPEWAVVFDAQLRAVRKLLGPRHV
jgi:hypothetical protein